MDWLKLSLSGIFCLSFILIALYSGYSELMFYWKKRFSASEHFTSLSKVRRRLLTSLILISAMTMIFTGVNFIKFETPKNFLIYWGICTIFALFLFILPLLDMKENTLMYVEKKNLLQKEMKEMKEMFKMKDGKKK